MSRPEGGPWRVDNYANVGATPLSAFSSAEICDPISQSFASLDRVSTSSSQCKLPKAIDRSRYEELREQYDMALAEGLLTAQEEKI